MKGLWYLIFQSNLIILHNDFIQKNQNNSKDKESLELKNMVVDEINKTFEIQKISIKNKEDFESFDDFIFYNNQQTFMLSPFTDHQWIILRKNILEKYTYEYVIDDRIHIQHQSQLFQEFKQKFDKKRAFDSFNSFSLTNISSIQNIDITDDSSFLKSKFTEEFQFSIINSALREVKSNCCYETYQTVRNYVFNNRQKEYQSLQKTFEKQVKQNEELATTIIIKQRDYSTLQKQIFSLRQKSDSLEQQKKKFRKKIDQIMQKEKRISKIQMSLVFKQKLNLEGKRRYQRQFMTASEVLKKVQCIYDDLNKVWQNIFRICEQKKCDCQQECWKRQVMRKAKQKIIQQRNILKQQERQLQVQYEVMQNISDQFKKIFTTNQNEKDKSQLSMSRSSHILE